MVETVDYTKRIPSNRRNIEAANRMVHADYDRGAQRRHQLQQLKNRAVAFDRRHTGIAQFARDVGKFQKAQEKYRTDKGLGWLESGWKSPFNRDTAKWGGNMLYNVAELVGDVFKTGSQALGTAATGIDFIPGDEGIGGEWAKMQGYNPTFETAFGNIPNPWYDDLKAGEFEMAMGDAERSSGANLLKEKDFLTALGDTNFQNHLRNYGLDLEGVKKEDMVSTLEKFYVDKFYDQFSEEMGSVTIGDMKYSVPQEWKDRYEGYTDEELAQAFDKDMSTFSSKEWGQIANDYQGNVQKKYTDTLMEKFDFNEDELAYAMSKGETPLHMGLWEDLVNENTMPFMPDDFQFEYETDEAKKLAESGWSSLPEWAMYGPAFGSVRKGSGILSKATEGTKAGALNKIYQNIYPGLSGSGGPIPWKWGRIGSEPGTNILIPGRSMWQFPAATYGASLRETGGE